MFTFESVPVKFVGLIVLFVFCVAWGLVELARSRTAEQRVSAALHLLMAVVMLVMVPRELWVPLRTVVGLPALVVVFVACTLWFVWLAARPSAASASVRRTSPATQRCSRR